MPDETRGIKVLVVDDEHAITDTLATILESSRYQVAKAYGADEAIAVAIAFQPDILLSDIAMPDGTGVSAAMQIVERVPHCKVLLISGQAGSVDLLQEAREKGFEFPILAKPLPPEDLLQIVRSLVTKAAERVTILNVDDYGLSRRAITRVLTSAGFSVVEAGTGTDALKKAEELHPDLILLDLNLPDVSGFEVCRRLKANPATASISVVHLTATYRDEEARIKALAYGADGFLTHPVEPDFLRAYVHRFAVRRKPRAGS